METKGAMNWAETIEWLVSERQYKQKHEYNNSVFVSYAAPVQKNPQGDTQSYKRSM